MFIHHSVLPIAALAFHLADKLLVVLVVLTEYGEKRLVVHAHAKIRVAHLLRRDITVLVAHLLVSLVDAHTNLVQLAVGLLRHDASTAHAPEFHAPHFLFHVQLATELRNLAVYGDAAHDWNQSVLLWRIALQIE